MGAVLNKMVDYEGKLREYEKKSLEWNSVDIIRFKSRVCLSLLFAGRVQGLKYFEDVSFHVFKLNISIFVQIFFE